MPYPLPPKEKAEHIGDGVYIWTDGYHFWIGTHDGYGFTNQVALDSHVQSTLYRIMTQMKEPEEKEE